MRNLVIAATAIALLSSVNLSGVQAAPVDRRVAPGYMPIDCMERDGDPSGCWGIESDYGPDMGSFVQDHGRLPTTPDARAYFGNKVNTKARAIQSPGN
jgi:hypothetical protein